MTPITFSLATCEFVLASDLDSYDKQTANHLIAMDETAKPLRIPPEMAIYAEKHEIFDLVQTLVMNLMVDKPEDPIQYLVGLLKRGSVEVPRVMLLGPPASGKRTIARKLCEHTQVIHITASNILKEDTDLTKKALQYKTKQQEIPGDLWIKLIQQRLSKIDCVRRGWVLEGIPQTREEALSLQEAGVAPNHVVLLEAPDAVLIERSQGKRIDPVTGVLTYILSQHRSVAPHTPRVLLFGPPGSGKSLQAKLISQKYNIVNLCCGELLEAVSADATNMGELIKPYLESGQQVPDSMVLQILTERLSRLDCTTRGWVLHGFPRDLEQAEKLQESNFIPSRVFFLEMTDDVAIERVTLRSIDPVTGERYHSLYKPAPSPEVQTRLQFNPKDSEAQLLRRLKEYWANAYSLQDLYPEAVHINADQDPHTVFESLESRLVGRLPKSLPDRGQNYS
ncbi:adenylate kinase 8 isoform X4 [Coregonus clupeaformis]|uniref:adenylate kinase 8 isoform X4 n=1 Tax=Coregonus clupeaformis TaxID=59861 RepID=UPI001BE01D85|nr:adenylate kinase 8 isoform X4 [Coregonus clupeaformis]